GDAQRFAPVERIGPPRLDVTEATGARTRVAHHQEGRRAASPAFADVRAHRLFADCVQFFAAHQAAHHLVGLATRRTDPDPRRTAQRPGFVGRFVDPPPVVLNIVHAYD